MLKFGRTIALVVVLVASVAGCGKSEAEKEAEAGKSGEGTVTCTGNALTGETGLPAGFPELDGVTFVAAKDRPNNRTSDRTRRAAGCGIISGEWGRADAPSMAGRTA